SPLRSRFPGRRALGRALFRGRLDAETSEHWRQSRLGLGPDFSDDGTHLVLDRNDLRLGLLAQLYHLRLGLLAQLDDFGFGLLAQVLRTGFEALDRAADALAQLGRVLAKVLVGRDGLLAAQGNRADAGEDEIPGRRGAVRGDGF